MSNDATAGQIIKTARTNDAQFKLVDGQAGTTSTKFVSVVNDTDAFSAGINDAGIPAMFKSKDGKHREGAADAAGNQYVVVVSPSGTTPVNDYLAFTGVTALVKPVASVLQPQIHDKVITASKTASNVVVTVASTGLVKWDIGTYNGTTFTIMKTIITSPAHPNERVPMTNPLTAPGTGTLSVHVVGSNLDNLDTDGYSTLEWMEA